ncbi:hypothetical protein SBRCBS47491_001334 [Sporothrix bragantina]|uniref:Acetylserotonin methytransferase-like protein n=1 Tax=Sporothrix bragantina TaxID=671064 RepID=A0ABP0AXM9_9PEZI
MSGTVPSGGFSLFPSTGRPPSRTQANRLQAATPEPATQHHQYHQQSTMIGEAMTAEVQVPATAAPLQASSQPAQLQSQPLQNPDLVRDDSVRSRSSIAKVRLSLYDDGPPVDDDPPPPMPSGAATLAERALQQQSTQPSTQRQNRPPALRSIFPQYNPDLPLDEQSYFPTQTSPTRIPRNVISRPLYSPVSNTQQQQQQIQNEANPSTDIYSPMSVRVASPSAASMAPAVAAPAPVAQPAPSTRTRPTVQITPPSGPSEPAFHSGPVAMPRGEAPKLPVPSSSDDLRSLWKVANGWKAGPSEGRVFCMKMSCDRDAPVYRLSSSNNQPFYRLRLDPTSMSAYVTLSRHDPARPFKIDAAAAKSLAEAAEASGGEGSGAGGGSSRNSVLDMSPPGAVGGGNSSIAGGTMAGGVENAAAAAAAAHNARFDASKNWQVAMTTTLEEESRRHQPQDGLVALLYPAAATRMALERPNDVAMVATAERECARLVWDDDTATFFLVHPVLALPFAVTVERSTTWSRTAYTLEHRESPQHLARLTRDGTGAGYLEVDTGIASKIDAVYLVDVVVTALLLVAHSDDQFAAVEQFAPPPDQRQVLAAVQQAHLANHHGSPHASLVNLVLGGAMGRGSASRLSMRDGSSGGGGVGSGGRDSKSSGRRSGLGFFGGKKPKKAKTGRGRMDELDLDLESQTSIDLSGKMFEMGPMGGRNTMGMMDNGGDGGGMTASSKKKRGKKERNEDKMPGCLRMITALFKCCFWCVAIVVRAIIAILNGIFRCLTSEKLV